MFLIKWLAILIYGRDNVEEFEKSNAKDLVNDSTPPLLAT